ncbi:hypothetical protein NL676_017949 [Syzygium grande]|nr:hypothetical protein NL676_017949 [Syzygium grande]
MSKILTILVRPPFSYAPSSTHFSSHVLLEPGQTSIVWIAGGAADAAGGLRFKFARARRASAIMGLELRKLLPFILGVKRDMVQRRSLFHFST